VIIKKRAISTLNALPVRAPPRAGPFQATATGCRNARCDRRRGVGPQKPDDSSFSRCSPLGPSVEGSITSKVDATSTRNVLIMPPTFACPVPQQTAIPPPHIRISVIVCQLCGDAIGRGQSHRVVMVWWWLVATDICPPCAISLVFIPTVVRQ
jgi:hypothetical protein